MTTRSSRVGVGGPLARYSVRFDNELKEQGYREHPRIGQLQRLGRLSRFMLARQLDAYALTGSLVMEFLAKDSAGATRVKAGASVDRVLGRAGLDRRGGRWNERRCDIRTARGISPDAGP